MIAQFDQLVAAVQRNCHIADARHARDMTMCTYLLEMREFYRWEAGIPPGDPLARPEVGAWLSERESLWETLGEDDFRPVPVAGDLIEPFAAARINDVLVPQGLVYGAGIGRFGKPHFFLGKLASQESDNGLTVLVCECEYARDLTTMPAALQGQTVIVRREALRQWLWEKLEAWQVKKTAGAFALALQRHGYADDPLGALERMTDAETATLILHERGEHAASRLLGIAWEDRLACSRKRRAEILMRAVRDNLADCLVTLPQLIEREAWASLWFWFSNFDGMRREIWPALASFDYEKVGAGETAGLRAMLSRGAAHWETVARQLLAADEAAVEALSHNTAALALA
jgi:hypothetical protein